MAGEFTVVTDNSGRINYYLPADHPDTPIKPEEIATYLDGGERVSLKGSDYELTENGSLIHPEVDMEAASVELDFGVRIDEGTNFSSTSSGGGSLSEITLMNRARVMGTTIEGQVIVDHHARILGKYIGSHTLIGAYARVGQDTIIGAETSIGANVKIDVESQIGSHVTIGKNARLGFNTVVGRYATIGEGAKIGVFSGAAPRGVNQDGMRIPDGAWLLPGTRLRD